MKKTTEKVSYPNYCLYICGVMKDDGFHRTKTKPNEKLLLLKLKNEKLMLNTCYSRNYADFTGKGVFLPTVF